MKCSKCKIVNGQIFKKAANLGLNLKRIKIVFQAERTKHNDWCRDSYVIFFLYIIGNIERSISGFSMMAKLYGFNANFIAHAPARSNLDLSEF